MMVLLLLSVPLIGCDKPSDAVSSEENVSSELPYTPKWVDPDDMRTSEGTKDGVAELVAAVSAKRAEDPEFANGETVDEEQYYNITPTAIAADSEFRIFARGNDFNKQYYILKGNEAYYLGNASFVSLFPCDYDSDGVTDIICSQYTRHSGLYDWPIIGYINGSDMEYGQISAYGLPSFINQMGPVLFITGISEEEYAEGAIAGVRCITQEGYKPYGRIFYENDQLVYREYDGQMSSQISSTE